MRSRAYSTLTGGGGQLEGAGEAGEGRRGEVGEGGRRGEVGGGLEAGGGGRNCSALKGTEGGQSKGTGRGGE